jgi:hypothetical protein
MIWILLFFERASYTYAQVISIIGDYKNITWSDSPYDSVTPNGTDNTGGTGRTYVIDGTYVVETITTYSMPPNGSHEEIHALDLLSVPAANVSDYDDATATTVCNGAATTFNFINFCATNASTAAAALHMLHLMDAQTAGVFLADSISRLVQRSQMELLRPPLLHW